MFKRLLLLFFLICFFTPLAYSVSVDVVDISNRSYAPVVLSELNNAKQTIDVAMYSMYLHSDDPANPVQSLVNALAAAQKRGVKVTVFLDADKNNNEAYWFLTATRLKPIILSVALSSR